MFSNRITAKAGGLRGRRQMRSGYLHVVTVAGVLAFTLAGTGSAQAATSTVPSAPSNVAEQPGYDAALVMWTVPANGGTSITGFRIDTFNGTTRVGQTNLTAGAVGSPLDPTPGANDWYNVGLTGGLRVCGRRQPAIDSHVPARSLKRADGSLQPATGVGGYLRPVHGNRSLDRAAEQWQPDFVILRRGRQQPRDARQNRASWSSRLFSRSHSRRN